MSTLATTPATIVAAYFWPAYHHDERWKDFFRGTEGEWEIIRHAQPKFPGHFQPRVPLWGFEDDSEPHVMERKIETAVKHGVNCFAFDWYWYDGRPFLERPLNEGFLKARNNDQISFYIMWANHDATTLWDLDRSHLRDVIWPGAVDRPTFDTVADRIIRQYLCHPSYLKIDGRPVFSIYDLGTLIQGLGGVTQTRAALDSFRAKVRKAGFPDLHLQAILWRKVPESLSMVPGDRNPTQGNTIKQLGLDSLTNYQWCHYVQPQGEYRDWAEKAVGHWEEWAKEFPVPYYPHAAVGWDTNPRLKAFHDQIIVNQSPKLFEDALHQAKAYLDRRAYQTRMVTINSWNEWSEGSYLEPDEKFRYGFLEAVRAVFPPK